MVRKFIVAIDDSLRGASKDIDELERVWGAKAWPSGAWKHDGSHWTNRFICTECGYKLFDEPTNYCPECGADMRGVTE